MTKKECLTHLDELTDIYDQYETKLLNDKQFKTKLAELVEDINWKLMEEGL